MTDGVETFETRTAMEVVGFTMTQRCADEVFSQAGFPQGEGRDQVAVIELHDCFATNEVSFPYCLRAVLIEYQMITYDALRLCSPGGAVELIERGDNTVLSDANPSTLQFSDIFWSVRRQVRGQSKWRLRGEPIPPRPST